MVSGGFKALFHGFFDNRRERPALRMFAQSVIDHGLIAAAGRLRTRLEGGQYVGVDAHGDARLAAVRAEMRRSVSPRSVHTTTTKRPAVVMPSVTQRASSTLSGSARVKARASRSAVHASSKLTLCFARLSAAF